MPLYRGSKVTQFDRALEIKSDFTNHLANKLYEKKISINKFA